MQEHDEMSAEGAQADQLWNEQRAAALLSLKPHTLQVWRQIRRGPPFIKIGRSVRYQYSDLVAWIEANKTRPASAALMPAAPAAATMRIN
jgi:hypothetical protein